ncbi:MULTISPECIES: SMC-Scp complex subunit ScpB [unclassified Halomonas]|jgi:segregation and condensation protein B|uniref:SMC-Scp complex subunit ScpB n=1 Tax=unclassified Halomonas TaxID=2609666 RepID=UPI0005F9EC85|nr:MULTISPECIES: SMC-Scp complex subunit ScpB [unclassified Halomonas]KJZ16903.1 condensin subunit ScpB [Halomonas sp. S2151]MCO7214273.1 SMC-Scp complex subunit ScpB [Halomonas sp. OfavH-34-E]
MSVMETPDALDDIVEAALLAAGQPLALDRLEQLFDEHERPPRRALKEALERLSERHLRGAMELIETASGYQLRIRPRLANWVARLWDERPQRYSRALLETLALIAYRQPVTRGDIEEVRGVTVSGSIMRTLLDRGWIRVVGHRDVPGRPAVFATTRGFLDDFGLKTLDELPPMHELKQFEQFDTEDEPPPPPSALLAQADEPLDDDGETAEGETAEGEPAEDGSAEVGSERGETEEGEAVSPDKDEVTASREEAETTAGQAPDVNEPTAGTADDKHAGMASERARLSFADLEARLSERARGRVDDDAASGVEPTESENDE